MRIGDRGISKARSYRESKFADQVSSSSRATGSNGGPNGFGIGDSFDHVRGATNVVEGTADRFRNPVRAMKGIHDAASQSGGLEAADARSTGITATTSGGADNSVMVQGTLHPFTARVDGEVYQAAYQAVTRAQEQVNQKFGYDATGWDGNLVGSMAPLSNAAGKAVNWAANKLGVDPPMRDDIGTAGCKEYADTTLKNLEKMTKDPNSPLYGYQAEVVFGVRGLNTAVGGKMPGLPHFAAALIPPGGDRDSPDALAVDAWTHKPTIRPLADFDAEFGMQRFSDFDALKIK